VNHTGSRSTVDHWPPGDVASPELGRVADLGRGCSTRNYSAVEELTGAKGSWRGDGFESEMMNGGGGGGDMSSSTWWLGHRGEKPGRGRVEAREVVGVGCPFILVERWRRGEEAVASKWTFKVTGSGSGDNIAKGRLQGANFLIGRGGGWQTAHCHGVEGRCGMALGVVVMLPENGGGGCLGRCAEEDNPGWARLGRKAVWANGSSGPAREGKKVKTDLRWTGPLNKFLANIQKGIGETGFSQISTTAEFDLIQRILKPKSNIELSYK
jgi:hypothetical protein